MLTSYPVSTLCCELVTSPGMHGRISSLKLSGSWIIKNQHSWLKFHKSMRQKSILYTWSHSPDLLEVAGSKDLLSLLATVWKVNHLTVYHIKMKIISWAFLGSLSKYTHAYSLVAEMKKTEIKKRQEQGWKRLREGRSKRHKNREPHAKLPVAFICSIIYFFQDTMEI